MENKPKHGGKRKGAGRKPTGKPRLVSISAKVTAEQKAKYKSLGGSRWLREALDKEQGVFHFTTKQYGFKNIIDSFVFQKDDATYLRFAEREAEKLYVLDNDEAEKLYQALGQLLHHEKHGHKPDVSYYDK